MNIFTPDGKVNYDSLQLSLNKRMSKGVQFLVSYTYAGDANLDGAITGDDYSTIDFNIAVPGAVAPE